MGTTKTKTKKTTRKPTTAKAAVPKKQPARPLPDGGLRRTIELYWHHRIETAREKDDRIVVEEWRIIQSLFENGLISGKAILPENEKVDGDGDDEELAGHPPIGKLTSPFIRQLAEKHALVTTRADRSPENGQVTAPDSAASAAS